MILKGLLRLESRSHLKPNHNLPRSNITVKHYKKHKKGIIICNTFCCIRSLMRGNCDSNRIKGCYTLQHAYQEYTTVVYVVNDVR